MAEHVFVGFGFGPIQGGLFAKEAFQSGNFKRIVVAEIDSQLVDAVRAHQGSYYVNVARTNCIETVKIEHVELLNPHHTKERHILLEALTQATEITTCLPSIDFYRSVASLIAEGLKNSKAKATIIYTAENHNLAAEILAQAVLKTQGSERVQFLNTVIGKMSRVVTDPAEIKQLKLTTITPGIQRAFLVEEFNRILVTRTRIADFTPGINVFIEKDRLLPFEEAKLYGHNAIHSLLGFIGNIKGYKKMTEIKEDTDIMHIARKAFLEESGAALIKKYADLGDELFTETGYTNYAEDLLERMTNPYLADTVERVCRDVVRKLGIDERVFGTMTLALQYGIEPTNMALAALAGIAILLQKAEEYNLPDDLHFGDWRGLDYAKIEKIIYWLWNGKTDTYTSPLIKFIQNAGNHLKRLCLSIPQKH